MKAQDFPHVTPEHGAEAALEVFELNRQQLDDHDITSAFLAEKLKEELNACITRTIVVKSAGKMRPDDGEDGVKIFDPSGKEIKTVPQNGNGKTNKLWEGKTIITAGGSYHQEVHGVDMIDWHTRQRARQDAHKLRGDYPPERKELTGKNGGPVSITIIDRFGEKPPDQGDPDAAAP